jgi:broad specificity phosphatase PhoE
MPQAIYLTHPEVNIDANVPVPDWGLSDIGQARVAELVTRCDWRDALIVSSAERKAIETAAPIADKIGVSVEIREDTHENDRSATGFLKPDEFERAADAFFANPDVSFRGWETARDAQKRIMSNVRQILSGAGGRDVLICGHGGVGTLLYCALAGVAINRTYDQTCGGSWFAFDPETETALSHWAPIEALSLISEQ